MADPRLFSGLAVVSSYPPPWPVAVRFAPGGVSSLDTQDGGAHRITGTVDELGQSGAYRVRLHDRVSGRLIRETWSDASGAYSFGSIANRPQGYYLLAFDHGADPVNAAVADLVSPEPMP